MRPKVAFYWLASCGGCEEAVLDLAEGILPVTDAVDIVFWPVALDFKDRDVESMADHSIDIAFVNGAIRTTEQQRMALLLREKSKLVVAFGTCAHLGGIPGLANLTSSEEIFAEAYGSGVRPQAEFGENGRTLTLPTLFDSVFPLDRVIAVDYYVPGCPPPAGLVSQAFQALLSGELPAKGAVLAPDHALCSDCPRQDSRPQDYRADLFRRIPDCIVDSQTCLIAQGIPCLGSATRAGCGARCIAGNMPCTGCFGPTSHVRDFGCKALTLVASIAGSNEEQEIDHILEGIADPAGTFYRYSLPSGFLERKRQE